MKQGRDRGNRVSKGNYEMRVAYSENCQLTMMRAKIVTRSRQACKEKGKMSKHLKGALLDKQLVVHTIALLYRQLQVCLLQQLSNPIDHLIITDSKGIVLWDS